MLRLTLIFLVAVTSAPGAVMMAMSYVGDSGNPDGGLGSRGGVSYDYYIGTYEVTNSQYTEFLNNKAASDPYSLYNTQMSSSTHGGISRSGTTGSYTYSTKVGMENKPVAFVSFWDAARFSNWLTNGQGNGDTETGVYLLNGNTSPNISAVNRNMTAWNAGGFAIPTEIDTIVMRGGSFEARGDQFLQPDYFNDQAPTNGSDVSFGFRVSSLEPIPEPAASALLVGLVGLIATIGRRMHLK